MQATVLDSGLSRQFAQNLSALSQPQFSAALDGIFEHSPWIAERAWHLRPFEDCEVLADALVKTMLDATPEEQLALIKSHPELAGKAAIAGELTVESAGEQSSARLDACSPEEYARLHALNAAYQARFGFPFILAVRGMDRRAIIESFARRLENSREDEFAEALRQIARIASLRLTARVTAAPA